MVVWGVKTTALPAGSSALTLADVVFELLPVELASLSVRVAVPLASPVADESPVAEADLSLAALAVFRLPALLGSLVADAVAVGSGEDALEPESCLMTRASSSGSHSGQAYAETTGARERRVAVKCAAFMVAVDFVQDGPRDGSGGERPSIRGGGAT